MEGEGAKKAGNQKYTNILKYALIGFSISSPWILPYQTLNPHTLFSNRMLSTGKAPAIKMREYKKGLSVCLQNCSGLLLMQYFLFLKA